MDPSARAIQPIRVACSNTLTLAFRTAGADSIVVKHTERIHDRLIDAQEVLGLAVTQHRRFEAHMNVLAEKKFNRGQFVKPVPGTWRVRAGTSGYAPGTSPPSMRRLKFAAKPFDSCGARLVPGTSGYQGAVAWHGGPRGTEARNVGGALMCRGGGGGRCGGGGRSGGSGGGGLVGAIVLIAIVVIFAKSCG